MSKVMESAFWKSKIYYNYARLGSLNTMHPGISLLKSLAKKSQRIVDLGCGEGTKLNLLVSGVNKEAYGIDISRTGIKMAKKSYPRLKFIRGNLEKIPFEDEKFDLVYSAFVLEHLRNPQKVINEAIRITKKGGNLFFISPNFGSANRASPNFEGSRLKKFFLGFGEDLTSLLFKEKALNWNSVIPTSKSYFPDADTLVEPYLGSLINFLKSRGLTIDKALSCWSEELSGARIHQRIFRFLGEMGVYPFWMWGPHLVVSANKNGR